MHVTGGIRTRKEAFQPGCHCVVDLVASCCLLSKRFNSTDIPKPPMGKLLPFILTNKSLES